MNFILLTFLSGVFSSVVSDVTPNNEESAMEALINEENKEDEIKNKPANEENNNYKDVKEYVFTTQNSNGTQSEISVRATTDLQFALKNYKVVSKTTTPPTRKPSEEPSEKKIQRTQGPNEPAFWTMLAKALSQTRESEDTRDQLFQPIPSSDLNTTDEDEGLGEQNDIKLKLMLGISLATVFLFATLLAVSGALLYKLKMTYMKCDKEGSNNPEPASRSNFQPAEGASETPFAETADSGTFLGGASSELRRTDIRSKY